jgi:hypothetical protein
MNVNDVVSIDIDNASAKFAFHRFVVSTIPVENPASSRLMAVEDTQHHEPIAVEAILKDVRRAQNVERDLPVLLTSRDRPAKFRMSRENLRSGDDLFRDDRRKLRRLGVKKRRESIKVGEGIVRPFQIY